MSDPKLLEPAITLNPKAPYARPHASIQILHSNTPGTNASNIHYSCVLNTYALNIIVSYELQIYLSKYNAR